MSAHVDQARVLGAELEAARALQGDLARRRADMIRAAVEGGMTQSEVADALGISRSAVSLALMDPERRKANRRGRRASEQDTGPEDH